MDGSSSSPLSCSSSPASSSPPFLIDTFNDSWSVLPTRLLSYAHAVGEVVGPLVPASGVGKYFSGVTLAYGTAASLLRAKRVSEPIRDAETARKAGTQAGIDSGLTLWLECITLPGIGLGAVARATSTAKLGPRVAAGVSLAALPFIIAASSHASEVMMSWSFRPAIAYFARPSERFAPPEIADYVPPPPEDMLAEMEAESKGRGKNGHDALWALLPPDFDALDRERLKWALDGNPNTAYPMPPQTTTADKQEGDGSKGAPPEKLTSKGLAKGNLK